MKTVLITGASGNLGQTLVHHLHEKGYDLLATFQTEHDSRLFNHLPNIQTRIVDLLHEEAVATFIANEPPTNLRAAVLLVGGFGMGTLEETTLNQLNKLIQLNLNSAFTVVKALLPLFKKQGVGQFILIGARPTLSPDEGKNMVAYSMSKALIFSLAELINAEGKAYNVTATVVVVTRMPAPARSPTTRPTRCCWS